MKLTETSRAVGCLLGLAVGDAVGTTLEFMPRGSFEPITDMVGGGPFELPVGAWTDDTSMALCLGHSLDQQGTFDARDQMNRYVNWMEHGYMSSIGHCFDIGNATSSALYRYQASGEPMSGSTDPLSAGNGSIMRLAPVPIFYFGDGDIVREFSAESSRTTHAATECLDACRLLGHILHEAIVGADKSTLLALGHRQGSFQPPSPKIAKIAKGTYLQKSRDDILGSGYVVPSLEAALWCFAKTENYRDAVLMAANLGDDADTTAAIVGQIAGAFYGVDGIPQTWRQQVFMADEIEALAERLLAQGAAPA